MEIHELFFQRSSSGFHQVKLNSLPFPFEDVQFTHMFSCSMVDFSVRIKYSIVPALRQKAYTQALEAWHGVTFNFSKYFSRFHVIFPGFLFHFIKLNDFSRSALISPGCPGRVETPIGQWYYLRAGPILVLPRQWKSVFVS